ncbi:hypothetical protein GJ496_009917 [Pomphorhynchus laevis]|nr:hypothetical protein GJ496_009917 [Pomphorhynchus laevis]
MERYSRLKIRKVLGVGQNKSGAVFTSKIVQILGPMDYDDRMPAGFSIWQLLKTIIGVCIGFSLMAFGFTGKGITNRDITLLKISLSYHGGCMFGYSAYTFLSWLNGNRNNLLISSIASLVLNLSACMGSVVHLKNGMVWILFTLHFLAALIDGIYVSKTLEYVGLDHRTKSEEKGN